MFARDRHQRFPAENNESIYGVSGTKRSRIVASFLAVTRAPADLQHGWRAEILRHGKTHGFEIDRFVEGYAPDRLLKSAVLRIQIASNESDLRRFGRQYFCAEIRSEGTTNKLINLYELHKILNISKYHKNSDHLFEICLQMETSFPTFGTTMQTLLRVDK